VPAGLRHTEFVFGYEGMLHKSNIDSNQVPPGALISFIQKGLQYLELEANLNNVRPVSLLALVCTRPALLRVCWGTAHLLAWQARAWPACAT
jgi:hypothetical protein